MWLYHGNYLVIIDKELYHKQHKGWKWGKKLRSVILFGKRLCSLISVTRLDILTRKVSITGNVNLRFKVHEKKK